MIFDIFIVPIIKSAIKKMCQDRKKTQLRKAEMEKLKKVVKVVKKTKKAIDFVKAVSLIDKGVKNRLIHKNKAARLKSSLSKLIK